MRCAGRAIAILTSLMGVVGYPSSLAADATDRVCCMNTNELQEIGLCVSGPGGLSRPTTCDEAGRCYYVVDGMTGSKEDGAFQNQSAGPIPSRAICSSALVAGPVQKGPRGGDGIDLFSVFDADQDGDLDLKDIGAFLDTYEPAPNLLQSDAKLVAAECCFSHEEQLRVGTCLSGPKVKGPIGACVDQGTCVLGFSAPAGPGDQQYKLCMAGPFVEPKLSGAACEFWFEESVTAAFECNASYASGVTPFVTFDADGDADFDLVDLAKYLNEIGAE